MMEELSTQAAPSTAAFYILITSHNKTGGNQVWAGRGEAINSDSGGRRMKEMEEDGEKKVRKSSWSFWPSSVFTKRVFDQIWRFLILWALI